MTPPGSAAQIQKLAHALGVEPVRLAGLAGLPADDVRTLRSQIADALFEADKPRFVRMAALSKAVPGALAAKLTEFAMPPLLAARTAELIEPHRAVDLVRHLSDGYLADVSAAMDASRAAEVVAAIPAPRIATIGAELARRQEWVVIGGFVAQVSAPALAAAVRVFDGEQLLRIGFVLDDKNRLDDVSRLVTDVQIDAMLVAAADHGLWTELDDLLAHLSSERAGRMRTRFAAAADDVVAAIRGAAAGGALSMQSLAKLTA
ncbi:MAG: hypothetical protein DLM58_06355 [Pseudonocardiales bacterium]|nr:MAG: hypothetical protein DLM58_06355 [Pseudonocardiales bacterium]